MIERVHQSAVSESVRIFFTAISTLSRSLRLTIGTAVATTRAADVDNDDDNDDNAGNGVIDVDTTGFINGANGTTHGAVRCPGFALKILCVDVSVGATDRSTYITLAFPWIN